MLHIHNVKECKKEKKIAPFSMMADLSQRKQVQGQRSKEITMGIQWESNRNPKGIQWKSLPKSANLSYALGPRP